MIEFVGWIFDFENMDALDARGHVWSLMKLDKVFYVNYNRLWVGFDRSVGSWQYPFDDHRTRMELYERYEQWIIEEIILK